MRAQLDDRHMYMWDGTEPLNVGDWVLVPPSPWHELLGWCAPVAMRVTATGGDYGGTVPDDELPLIVRKLDPGEAYPGVVRSTEETTA